MDDRNRFQELLCRASKEERSLCTQVRFETSRRAPGQRSNAPYYSLGRQGLAHTPGCERYPFQPTVPTAITLQLPQTTTQSHTELPAARLGNEDRAQRPALLH